MLRREEFDSDSDLNLSNYETDNEEIETCENTYIKYILVLADNILEGSRRNRNRCWVCYNINKTTKLTINLCNAYQKLFLVNILSNIMKIYTVTIFIIPPREYMYGF